jgi:hypothetical protein
MLACYHAEATFRDPAFGELNTKELKAMWQMLVESQKDQPFVLKFSDVKATETHGSANWKAAYIFSKTGRRVLNKIHAEFEFKDGLIYMHHDHFNLYWWSCQALGIPGYLLGWTPFFKKKLQEQSKKLLKRYKPS